MKELKKKILSLLGQRLEDFGFESKPRGQEFWKLIPGGRVAFQLAFIKHAADFDITCNIGVRFDALESMLNADKEFLTKKQKEDTCSLGIEVGNLVGEGQKRMTVAEEADIPEVIDEIMHYFKRYIVPCYEKYSYIESAFKLLASNTREAWLYSPFHAERAKRALGLAALLGHKDELANLVREGSEFLRKMEDSGLQDYLQFSKKFV